VSGILNSRENLMERLSRGKSARVKFVESHLSKTLAYQLRATRDNLGWSQEKLAVQSGMTQHAISRIESPSYGKLTITTLKRLSTAMDVGLVVRLVPFSELIDWVSGTPRVNEGLCAASLAVSSFDREQSEFNLQKGNVSVNLGGGAEQEAVPVGDSAKSDAYFPQRLRMGSGQARRAEDAAA
jgi:transcriptional regulator with XRE-family HTH domain